MANYVKATNFTAKDSLPSGNAGKIVKGAELDTEYTAIASAISSKADLNSPALTGTPTAPTAASTTNTTQIATTAFVRTEITNLGTIGTMAAQAADNVAITGGSITGITDLAVADGGTGRSSLTSNNVILGNGTSGVNFVAPGSSGNVLTSNGTTWASSAPATSSSSSFVAKAWVSFTGSGSIQSSYNVASVSRTSTGQYTITFTNAMADSNYAVLCTAETDNDSSIRVLGYVASGGKSTSTLKVTCHNLAAYYNPTSFSVVVFA